MQGAHAAPKLSQDEFYRQLDSLTQAKAAGTLTEADFEARKAELLRQL
jgi:hypothetical protein